MKIKLLAFLFIFSIVLMSSSAMAATYTTTFTGETLNEAFEVDTNFTYDLLTASYVNASTISINEYNYCSQQRDNLTFIEVNGITPGDDTNVWAGIAFLNSSNRSQRVFVFRDDGASRYQKDSGSATVLSFSDSSYYGMRIEKTSSTTYDVQIKTGAGSWETAQEVTSSDIYDEAAIFIYNEDSSEHSDIYNLFDDFVVMWDSVGGTGSYYVSNTGSDSNNGTSPEYPFETMEFAMSVLDHNDTLYIMSDIADVNNATLSNGDVTITNYSGVVMPTVSAIGNNSNILILADTGNAYEINNVTVSNISLLYGDSAIVVRESNNVTITNVIMDTNTHGIYAADLIDCTFDGFEILNGRHNSFYLQLKNGYVHNVSITNFYIHDNPGTSGGTGHNGIDLNYQPNPYGDYLNYTFDGVTISDGIINNVTAGNSGIAAPHVADYGTYVIYNVTISNCSLDGNFNGIQINGFENSMVTNNIVTNSNQCGILVQGDTLPISYNVTFENNTVDSTNQYPLYFHDSPIYSTLRNNTITNYKTENVSYVPIYDPIGNLTIDANDGAVTSVIHVNYQDGRMFTEDGANDIIANATGTHYIDDDDSIVHISPISYSIVPTSEATVDGVSSIGCTVTLSGAENVTFGEMSTGNTTIVSLSSGDNVILFSELDFTSEETKIPLSFISTSPSGSTISIYNTSTLTTSITVNKEANISVYFDSVLVQTNTSVTTASYVNDSMTVGTHNLTMLAAVGEESVNRVWTVTVSEYVAPSEEEIDYSNASDIWSTNIGAISITMLVLIISVPLTILIKKKDVTKGDINTVVIAVIVLMVISFVAIVAVGVLQAISVNMP